MINLIITLVVGLFILSGFFWGFIRGLKKTSLRAIWLIVTAIICLIFSPLISQLLCNINISQIGININGTVAVSVKDAITLFISNALNGTNLEALPLLSSLSDKLPIIILNPFVFVILFWLLKIILLPINAIVAKMLFKKKKKESNSNLPGNELINKKENNTPVKKYRFYGSLVGIIVGLIVCTATFVPVFGILNIANDLNNTKITVINDNNENTVSTINETENTSSTKEISLLEYLLNENIEYYNEINNSIGLQLLKYTGIQSIGNMQFMSLTSTKVNNARISLSNDIKSTLSLSNDIITLSKFNFNNPTKETLNSVINSTISILEKSKHITLLQIISQEDIAYICNEALNNPDSLIFIAKDNSFTNNLTRTAIENLSEYDLNHIIDDIIKLAQIVKSANDNDVIMPIIDNQFESNQQIIQFVANISPNFYNTIIDNLFNIDIINSIIPMSAKYGIEGILNYLEIENNENTTFSVNTIKEYVKNMLCNGLDIIKEIDIDSKFIVNKNSIKAAGKLLDDMTKRYNDNNQSVYIISPTLKEKLLSKTEDSLLDILYSNFDSNLCDTITPFIHNIPNINNYVDEFNKIGDSFELLKPYIEFALNNPKLDDANELELIHLGKALDIIDSTTLINNKFYTLFNYALDNYVKGQTFNNVSLDNIANHLQINSENTLSYEVELTKLNELYKQIIKIVKDDNINNFIKSEEIKTLGKNIQTIKIKNLSQSTDSLFNTDTLIIDLLELVSGLNLNQDITQLIIDTRNEIINTTNKSDIDYHIEFTHIYNVIQALEDSKNNSINDYLTIADKIVNGDDELVASIILIRPIYNFITKNIPNANEYNEEFIKAIINNLNTNIETQSQQVNCKNEINNFIKLFNELDNLKNLNENSDNFENQLYDISQSIEDIHNNTILLTNLKSETISQLFSIVKDNVSNNDLKNALEVAKQDAINSQQCIYQIYQDIKTLKDEFIDFSYNEDDLNASTLSSINEKLKTTFNLQSFSISTTNKIYSIILDSIQNDVVTKIDNTDTSLLPQEKIDEIEQYKQEFIDLISEQKTIIVSYSSYDIENDAYLTSLNAIQTKIDNKPSY